MWSLSYLNTAIHFFDKHPDNFRDIDLLLPPKCPEEFFADLFDKNKDNLQSINFYAVEERIHRSKECLRRVMDFLNKPLNKPLNKGLIILQF